MGLLPKKPAARRYVIRILVSMGLYVVALLITISTFDRSHPVGFLAYALAILPAIPLLATIVAVGLYLAEEPDEFQRSVIIQAMLCGIGGTLAVTTVWASSRSYRWSLPSSRTLRLGCSGSSSASPVPSYIAGTDDQPTPRASR